MATHTTDLLTTRQAARLLGVGTTSVKRWADAGLLDCVRTPGRHRRIPRRAVEAMLGGSRAANSSQPDIADWLQLLTGDAQPARVRARLIEERHRGGAWWRVADALDEVLVEIGARWQRGELSILQEHLASERLLRAIAGCCERIEPAPDARTALLLLPEAEEHTIGLALAELCLRDAGWKTRWAGRNIPISEICFHLGAADVDLVAASAAASSTDADALRRQAELLGDACRSSGAELVLGGEGRWPDPPPYGYRLRSFEYLHTLVTEVP